MKDTSQVKTSKQPKVIINPELDKYDDMPLFQNKMDMATAFLEKHPLPNALVQDVKNKRIKFHFEQNMSIEQIADLLSLTQSEVRLSLQEMDLVGAVV